MKASLLVEMYLDSRMGLRGIFEQLMDIQSMKNMYRLLQNYVSSCIDDG